MGREDTDHGAGDGPVQTTPYYGHNYYRLSADEGATWTDPYVLTPHPGYVIMHNDRLVQLSSGRILAIAEYKAHRPSSDDHSGYAGISFLDDGTVLVGYHAREGLFAARIGVGWFYE